MTDNDLTLAILAAGLEVTARMNPARALDLAPVVEQLAHCLKAERGVAVLAEAPIWATYACLTCDDRRPGLPVLIGGYCRSCGPQKGAIIAVSLWEPLSTAVKASRAAGKAQTRDSAVVGLHVPLSARVGLSGAEALAAVERVGRELVRAAS